LPEGVISSKTTEGILPPFVPRAFIEKWVSLGIDEDIFDLEFCAFPTKEYTPTNYSFMGNKFKCDFSGLSEDNEFTIRTNCLLNESSLLFSADEVKALVSPNYEGCKKIKFQNLLWNESLKKKHPLKKVIELVYLENKTATAKIMWDILRKDADENSIYDPRCSIESMGNEHIELYGRSRALTFSTFKNYVTDCRSFYALEALIG